MQVTAYKSSDGQFFEDFGAYKAHEEALLIKAKLAETPLNYGAATQVDGVEGVVLTVSDLPKFLADNAAELRDLLNASVIVKRGRGPGKKDATKAESQPGTPEA